MMAGIVDRVAIIIHGHDFIYSQNVRRNGGFMEIKWFVDKIEDLVYQLTPDIDSLEEAMVAISDELRRRYATPALNTEYTKCEHKTVSWNDGKWFCEDCKQPVTVKARFA